MTITAPAAGAALNGAVTVAGTDADPGATVTVRDELGRVLGTATADARGEWSVAAGTLPDGRHTATAEQVDRFGRPSAPTSVSWTSDATAPDALTVASPLGTVAVRDTVPAVSGAGAEPGATVRLLAADGTVLATAPAAADGTFALAPVALPAGTPEGPLTVTVVQVDAAGNVSAPAPVQLTVDTSAAPPAVTAPTSGTTTRDTRPSLSGTAEPNGSVVVTLDGTALPATPVAADGTWVVRPGTALADGAHTLTAVQTDALGNVSTDSPAVTFTTDTTALPPVVTSALVDTTGAGTVAGTAEPFAHVVVRTATGTLVGEADADAQGVWSLRGNGLTLLTILTAVQTDPAATRPRRPSTCTSRSAR